MILKVLKIARAFRRVQFENFQNHEYLLFTNCTRRSCGFFIYSTFNKITSFPWTLNRYSYRVQFGINCTALDQSKLSNFVECTIIDEIQGVWIADETRSRVFDISSQSKQKLGSKQRSKIVKIYAN